MSLLKSIENGRMYPGWWRWNPIGGCLHDCSYCYMKAMSKRTGKDMLTPVCRNGENGTKNYMNDNLGSGRKIFVCSSGDMWGEWVSDEDIYAVLEHCRDYPENEYMFLTKNPRRYYKFFEEGMFPARSILGATVETNLEAVLEPYKAYRTPTVGNRLDSMEMIRERFWSGVTTMLSIEPVVQFDPDFSVDIYDAGVNMVYIGLDSGNNGLPEPSADELRTLIDELKAFTDVRLKKGIERILPGKFPAVGA